jgi:hypothetical protein
MTAVSTQVHARNGIGQFIKACEEAATQTVLDTIEAGQRESQARAPVRTGALRASIQPFLTSRTSGVWGSSLKYALAHEKGSGIHGGKGKYPISAYVRFFWDKAGRMWLHPDEYFNWTGHEGADPIMHPGVPATHYLRDGYEAIKPRMMQYARKNYPGG